MDSNRRLACKIWLHLEHNDIVVFADLDMGTYSQCSANDISSHGYWRFDE